MAKISGTNSSNKGTKRLINNQQQLNEKKYFENFGQVLFVHFVLCVWFGTANVFHYFHVTNGNYASLALLLVVNHISEIWLHTVNLVRTIIIQDRS